MNYADSNWLTALYLKAADEASKRQAEIVERFLRKHGDRLVCSHVTLLECRNVFRRITGKTQPDELSDLEADFNGKVFIDPMNWTLLRRDCESLFERYAHKTTLGTFDCAIVASARLAGASQFLSFDERAKALAEAERMDVFPPLTAEGKALLKLLRS